MAGGDFQHFSPILCGFLSHWLPGQIGWTCSSSSRQSLFGWEALQGGLPMGKMFGKNFLPNGMPNFCICKNFWSNFYGFFENVMLEIHICPNKLCLFFCLGMVRGWRLLLGRNWEAPSHTTCVRSLVVLVRVPFGMWWSMKQWMIDVRCGIPVTWKKRPRHDLKKWGEDCDIIFFLKQI